MDVGSVHAGRKGRHACVCVYEAEVACILSEVMMHR